MDWMSLLGVLLGVLLGGLVTLASQLLQASVARRAEIRRRTDEAAQATKAELLEIEDIYDTLYDSDAPGQLSAQGDEQLTRRIKNFRSAFALVADSTVRARLNQVADALIYSTDIMQFHGDSQLASGRFLCRWGNEVLDAYLRGEDQPDEPEKVNDYQNAIEEAAQIMEEQYKELERERRGELDSGGD